MRGRRSVTASYSIVICNVLEEAIDQCMGYGVFDKFLNKHINDVMVTLMLGYDPEEHIRMEREESYKEGYEKGCKEALENARKSMGQ